MSARVEPLDGHEEIARLRDELDEADDALVALMARRSEVARRIGAAKRAVQLPVVDLAREAAVVRQAVARARAAGLDGESVRQIFWCLIELGRREQRRADA